MMHLAQSLVVMAVLSLGAAPAAEQQPFVDLQPAVHVASAADQAAVTPVRWYRYGGYYGGYYPGWYAPRYYYRPYYYPGPYYSYYPGWYGYRSYYSPYGFYYRGPGAYFGFGY
jgi:hypothetical protein